MSAEGRGREGREGGRAVDDGLELEEEGREEKRDWTWMMMTTTVVLMVARPRTRGTHMGWQWWQTSGGWAHIDLVE